MATKQLKTSQKIDLDSFQGIDWHRELVLLQKVIYLVAILTDSIQNRHLNLHVEAVCPSLPTVC